MTWNEREKLGNKGNTPTNKADLKAIMNFIETNKLESCNFTELCRLLEEYGHIS